MCNSTILVSSTKGSIYGAINVTESLRELCINKCRCYVRTTVVYLALETGLGALLTSVEKTIESAVNAQHMAAKAVSAHTDLLKNAMDVSLDRQCV